jgi:geranylgeranyl diphosphate synthase type II
MLVLMAAEACGGSLSAAMPAACAVEMIHTYSLIHDDLPAMDDDDLRRGRPTCHKVFGEAMAILAGDGLLSLAFQVLAEGIRPQTVAAACCAALAEASGPCQLVGGQADDIAHGQNVRQPFQADKQVQAGKPDVLPRAGSDSTTVDREHLESIHARKTGAMIRVSLRLGGMTAGAAAESLQALDEYGRRLGLAFQITDDLLDVRSTEESMGKRVGKDAEKGKITFPGLLGVDESAAYAAQLIAEACAALGPLGPRADGLTALARYVLERDR